MQITPWARNDIVIAREAKAGVKGTGTSGKWQVASNCNSPPLGKGNVLLVSGCWVLVGAGGRRTQSNGRVPGRGRGRFLPDRGTSRSPRARPRSFLLPC